MDIMKYNLAEEDYMAKEVRLMDEEDLRKSIEKLLKK
jgi:hypothetical protein